MKNVFILILSLTSFFQLSAQTTSEDSDNSYLFPIKPGARNYFAGSMGELRTTHFHGGLDIKTGGVEGWPIHAAADGYISRMKVSSFGYGRVLYMIHPNGETTVYAHQQRFNDELEQYIVDQQYKKKSFEINLENLPKDQFVFKKGDIIGYGGNSGSSSAPHLHFEIRDKEERPLNPVDFGFSEVVDNIPPIVRAIRLKPLEIDSRVNGTFETQKKNVSGQRGTYKVTSPFYAQGKVGIEIDTYDRADGTYNKYGINVIKVFDNDRLVYHHLIDRIPFDLSANINTFTDFEAFSKERKRYQRLYRWDANHLPIYPNPKLDGFLNINNGEDHQIRIELWDSFQNKTTVGFHIKGKTTTPIRKTKAVNDVIKVKENILMISSSDTSTDTLYLNFPLYSQPLPLNYTTGTQNVYLWDLRHGIPASYSINNTKKETYLKHLIPSGKHFIYYDDELSFEFDKETLFDSLYLNIEKINNEIIIGQKYQPMHHSVIINYKVKDSTLVQPKNFVYKKDRKGEWEFVGGTWNGNTITFKTNRWGTFGIFPETTPPKIIPLKKWKHNQLRFKISDDESGIASYSATLNGEFILLEYDAKKDYLQTRLQDDKAVLKGKFELKVIDKAGNVSNFTLVLN
ncbi:peptidoglycan DD-metalloendopeptidase family protein [Flammeovirga yaeyamensis]|uniref:Peptidoglycan DD-metalloendopeptidase family protein n=1 Tax=Flammeovirga yaeyamensis TaxID=367791 RepID=A0AAX1N657_9BACT|nr:M23 family metallopeptidase [Flammeovirga yaeyamensis]MBB3697655.1 hypothetical protein [Flammeovirga yaeyamensis]NMF35985.1 M23 family metallopeptidase [Flammeovirga yaeyamensis]QWG03069.1 peptidoglycan DD-metalloendopeptidase family protein [Flammeovirga yaeyamensis]